jgi:spermidine synthase
LALFLLCSILGHSGSFAFWEDDLVYEGESIYNYLQVKETERSVTLSTNVLFGVQSIRMKDDSLTGMYYDYALAAPLMAGVTQKDAADILILGMGTGTYATQCRKYFDYVNVEGVEIDQKITDLAGKYFELPDSVEVTTYDGRAYLQAVDKKYDVIMVDAYQDITIPFQMSSVEFFAEVKEHLKESGVMVVNMNMKSDTADGEGINAYLADTIASVFDTVYTADVKGMTNRELFASDNPDLERRLTKGADDLVARAENEAAGMDTAREDVQLAKMMRAVAGTLQAYEGGGLILTDDKAPVEVLGMQVIDELIRGEIGYYKNIFREEGIRGLLGTM